MTRRVSIAFCCGLLILGSFLIWGALKLPYDTRLGPGAGFFPFWLALILVGLAAIWIAQAWRAPRQADDAPFLPEPSGAVRMAGVIVSMGIAAALLERIGFLATLMIAISLVQALLGDRKLWRIASLAIIVPVTVRYIFIHLLNIPLPTGSWG